ncbi:tetratricopeptide repeat protein [Fibrella sp. HMF5335]|uniref:Tetratricopeptide repeat protein n=1 Tax=Fibrella rubiginis TaxID=2817060 RepID=A0A939GEL7_9BACT|nr:tetratricopeptide repeat protein [Fibrella rubiginis]MBO0935301.1 tetratricopeptide repeat protein [Fibrella rubiginis]
MDTVTALLAQGAQFIVDKNYAEARRLYSELIAQDPKNQNAWLGWGNAYFLEEKYEEAKKIFEDANLELPDNQLILASIGGCLRQLGRDEEAEVFKRNIEEAIFKTSVDELIKAIELSVDRAKVADYITELEKIYAQSSIPPAIEGINSVAWLANYMGRLCLERKKPDLAIVSFVKAIEKEPDYAEAYAGWGHALYIKVQDAEAFEKYKISLSKNPSPKLAYEILQKIGGMQGKTEQEHYQQYVIDTLQAKPDLVLPLNRDLLIGDNQARLKQYEKAIEAYENAKRIKPDQQSIYVPLAKAYHEVKKYDKERENLRTSLHYTTQQIITTQQQTTDLEERIKQADDTGPTIKESVDKSSEANVSQLTDDLTKRKQELADLEYKAGQLLLDLNEDVTDVWNYWQKTIDAAPASENTRKIADAMYDRHIWEKAVTTYKVYLKNNKSAPDPYSLVYVGIALSCQYQYEQSENYLKKALAVLGNHQVLAHIWLGHLNTDKRMFPKAEDHYRAAFRLDSTSYQVIEALVSLLSGQKKTKDALEVCEKAMDKYVKTAPVADKEEERMAEVFYLKGNVYLDSGELEEAKECYRMAINKDGKHVLARHNMSFILEKQGRYGEARDEWGRVAQSYNEHTLNLT